MACMVDLWVEKRGVDRQVVVVVGVHGGFVVRKRGVDRQVVVVVLSLIHI